MELSEQDFAISANHQVNREERVKKDKYLHLA